MTALVLVHGHPETAAVWAPLLRHVRVRPHFTLSPPGFGAPRPRNFPATVASYRDWLIGALEQFREPVHLLGHDWGGVHVLGAVMSRPDLVASWTIDDIGLFDPDYEWHPVAQRWQDEQAGRAILEENFGGTFERRHTHATALGMHGQVAEQIAAGMGPELIGAAFDLYRSAKPPALRELGVGLEIAAGRPGLALRPILDTATGSDAMIRRSAARAGARLVELPASGHWWMLDDPERAAQVLDEFWTSLDPEAASVDGSSRRLLP